MMDAFNTIADLTGNVAAVVAAVGVLFVNAKLDRLIDRVDTLETTVATHVTHVSPGLHR